jgi:MSHA biogenesis protein MshO
MMSRKFPGQQGFTLVEMIVVIVITGILGGIVAVFLRSPVQGYVDSARRAEMTDIADTALRRITRDLRLALPNSVRVWGSVSGAGTCNGSETCYLEFIPTTGGGRYRVAQDCSSGTCTGDILDFMAPDTSFEVLGTMPSPGNYIVVDNLGIPRPASCPAPLPANCGTDAYEGDNRAAYAGAAGNILSFAAHQFPFDSPSHRFQVVSNPATYVCAPATSGNDGSGTLTRYWGYNITDPQPTSLATLTSANAGAMLADKVSACSFLYDPNVVAQRSGLVTMRLAITENGETINLYNAVHVSNEP